jgi:hypothetical protein
MLEPLRQYRQYIRFYDLDNLPLNRDCFLLSDNNNDLLNKQWLEFLSPQYNQNKWKHPNELMDYIPCHFSSVSSTHADITLLLDRNLRFHTVRKFLPLNFLLAAFQIFTSEKRSYIVVSEKWFAKIKNSNYSTYALIDFIGIRNLIMTKGEIPSNTISKIKDIIDRISKANPDLVFLSCADNIIVKSGWSAKKVCSKYKPESFIQTVNDLMNQLKAETEIDSYAILTQGVNYINEKELAHTRSPKNHFFMSSIAVPFIEAFEIDNNIREQIRNKRLIKAHFYVENSLYMSLKRRFFLQDEPSWFKKISFMTEKLKTEVIYIPLSFDQIGHPIQMT